MLNEANKTSPKLFINNIKDESGMNQHFVRTSPVTQFIENQNHVNSQLRDSFREMNKFVMETKYEQNKYFDYVKMQFEKQENTTSQVNERVKSYEENSERFIERIKFLEKQNEELKQKIESDNLINQAIMDQLSSQESYTQKIINRLENHDQLVSELNNELTKQLDTHSQLNEKLNMQEVFHQTVLERLEEQEALTQKIVRQMDNLKAIIYERFSHFAEKIESNMKLTTSYLFSHMTKPTLLKGSVKEKDEKTEERELINK